MNALVAILAIIGTAASTVCVLAALAQVVPILIDKIAEAFGVKKALIAFILAGSDVRKLAARVHSLEEMKANISNRNNELWSQIWDLEEQVSNLEEQLANSTSPVLQDILAERASQDAQWGGPAHDDEHFIEDWLDFIEKQTQTARVVIDYDDRNKRLVKIAALAIAALESRRRKVLT